MLGLVLLVVVSGNAYAHPSSFHPPHALPTTLEPSRGRTPTAAAPLAPIDTTLTVNSTAIDLSSQFWGATVNNEVHEFRGETNALNATPARVLVWPGAMAGEDYDPLTDTHYDTNTGSPIRALTNESQFVQMCRATNCSAIVQVPAEIDDPQMAEAIVNYTEVNLSFHPAYWMIGNEPELWSHWKVPWKEWPYQYTGGPTPTQFGNEVLAYVAAIRNVDNSTPILGLPASGCTCGSWTFSQWIYQVLKVTGPKIQAVAFHEYPAGWLGTGDGSLQDFYGTIQSAASIPSRMVPARAAVQSACPGCNVTVFISELGSALSWSSYGQYAIGFSGSLSLASQLTQAMDDNLTNVDLFAAELATTNSWFNPQGGARSDYGLYTQILDHLGPQAYAVNASGVGRSVYAIDTVAPADQSREDLMVVNDNITHAVAFTPQFANPPGGVRVASWSWNGSIHTTHANGTTWVEPYTPNAVPQEFPGGLPASYTLPPQSLVLFEAYPSNGTYVEVKENGVPSPTPWYAQVGSRFYTSTAGNISLLLPEGAYPVGSVGIPLPIGGRELNPSARLGPYVDSPFRVSGAYSNTTIDFVNQSRVNVIASPADGGTVSPGVAWWNDSEPLTLTATPAPGFAFIRWSGWGPGSYNGTGRTVTLDPAGRITEKALFAVGEEVNVLEYGLRAGTPWSISIRGFTTSSTSSILTVYEPDGSYGFSVSSIPGYRSLPKNGGFTVQGSTNLVVVWFLPITPPQPSFPVTFHVSGLPEAATVSITVRDASQTAGTSAPQFQLLNGSYAYRVGYVAGFHAAVPEKTFQVTGGPLTVDVPFVPTVYHATWQAVGVRAGMNWSVEIDGRPIPSTSAWASVSLPNGSYSYRILVPSNFTASPRTGTVEIDGYAAVVHPVFTLMEFPTWFAATGPGAASAWSVRLGNVTQGAWSDQSSFLAANGTYTFDVHPPAGYYAVPSHGRVTISGPMAPIQIQFHPTSEKPSAALVAALSSGALSVSLWIGASFFGGFGIVRWLRRREG